MTQLQNKPFNLRRVKNVNIIEMYKNESSVFLFQICKFVTFLYVSSWLFKLLVVSRALHSNVHAVPLRYEVHRKIFFSRFIGSISKSAVKDFVVYGRTTACRSGGTKSPGGKRGVCVFSPKAVIWNDSFVK